MKALWVETESAMRWRLSSEELIPVARYRSHLGLAQIPAGFGSLGKGFRLKGSSPPHGNPKRTGGGEMPSQARYLTKSRYRLGTECPTKLFYTGKDAYPDQREVDPFLAALAEGGYQVGELAKHYFPGGHDIKTLNHDDAEAQTRKLLENDNAVIYEAAIKHGNLFIRVDILKKTGHFLDLIEVKAKSFDRTEDSPFLNKTGRIRSKWMPYLQDVAFQRFVVAAAFPQWTVVSYLMMPDKNTVCTVDGLNQKFMISRDATQRKCVHVSSILDEADVKDPILARIPVDEYLDMLCQTGPTQAGFQGSWEDEIAFFSDHYQNDERIWTPVRNACKSCEFRATRKEEEAGKRSGFKECWSHALGWKDKDFEEPSVLDIWNFRHSDRLIQEYKTKMEHVTEADINPQSDGRPGLSRSERQWLQVKKAQTRDDSIFLDREGLKAEMSTWAYPLHFIDFETSMVAIPFNAGRRPYEGIAFQFSHHTVAEDGSIAHVGQFLCADPGVFPNFQFIRALEKQLEQDQGTLFMYASHENNFLNTIYHQLKAEGDSMPDRDRLCAFIRTISRSTGCGAEQWAGERAMVDMCHLVKRYHFDPATRGSNSIKSVLPAVLNASRHLQSKYSKPIYGAANGIPSLNFTDWTWIEMGNGEILDPYHKLPRLFVDDTAKMHSRLSEDDEIRSGGAALTAYAHLQFAEMTDYERSELIQGLLKYCELDTFAMVLIWEFWASEIG